MAAIRVLVVEDDPDIRHSLEVLLKSAGFDTVWAEDADAAITVCSAESPDIILLDLGLVGGDGFMVMERLKSLNAVTPIIVLSARDPALNEAHALRLGAVAFMQKPPKWKELLATIKKNVPDKENRLCGAR